MKSLSKHISESFISEKKMMLPDWRNFANQIIKVKGEYLGSDELSSLQEEFDHIKSALKSDDNDTVFFDMKAHKIKDKEGFDNDLKLLLEKSKKLKDIKMDRKDSATLYDLHGFKFVIYSMFGAGYTSVITKEKSISGITKELFKF